METKTVNIRLNDILHRRQLSSTESRRKILTLFLNSDDALTHGDIEKEVGSKYDRVTIYRTLQTFEEKGIIQEHHLLNLQSRVQFSWFTIKLYLLNL